MSYSAWPNTLPQYVLQDGFSEKVEDQLIESQMDAGRAKTRRRFTAPLRLLNVSLNLTAAQRTAFETFYFTTLQAGALPFTWVNPITQAAADMRFRNPAPQYASLGGDLSRVSFAVEVL